MVSKEIKGYEILYRAIKRSRPSWIDYGKPTSAMFRDVNGVSVDRDGGREEPDIIEDIRKAFGKRLKGLVKLTTKDCYAVEATVEAAPSADNEYHANIWLDMRNKKKEMLQAYRLAQASVVVFIDEKVEWV